MLTTQPWVLPGDDLYSEYLQCRDEGLQVEQFEASVKAIEAITDNEQRNKLSLALYDEMESQPMRPDYPYVEPNDLADIKAARPAYEFRADKELSDEELVDRVRGEWHGRIIGCLLGKPIEGIRRPQLEILMKEVDNEPPRDYFRGSKMDYDAINAKFGKIEYQVGPNRPWADCIGDAAPDDDDTTYTIHMLQTLKRCGTDATTIQIQDGILHNMPYLRCCTAERVAYRNSARGMLPPKTAVYYNPYRELIGARIRADSFGFVNPGKPERAAEMAYRDAVWSHVKNGVYSEMFAAAMIAAAPYCDTADKIVETGLSQIPANCRLSASVRLVLDMLASGKTTTDVADYVHAHYNENHIYGWCHAISNDMLVVSALIAGKLDFTKTMGPVERYGFDTDSNGATTGAILGACLGEKAIPAHWKEPYHGKQRTSLLDIPLTDIDYLANTTLNLIKK